MMYKQRRLDEVIDILYEYIFWGIESYVLKWKYF